MVFQWYPGHMTKAKRMMEENIKLVDLVIELVDARIPMSSRNPDIDSLAKNKARIILLNKSDLADDKVTEGWISYFRNNGFQCVKLNARNTNAIKQINSAIQTACAEKIERDKAKGILNRTIKAMVVGIPNVGKSTFINSFSGKKSAKTGNKPGVTKGKQWIKLNNNLELLDTPGILWPRFDDQTVGMRLAMIGSMNDEVLNIEELAMETVKYIYNNYPDLLFARYGLEDKTDEIKASYDETAMFPDNTIPLAIMDMIAIRRGCIKKGSETDYMKVANVILDDFRSGKIGNISLESIN
ncbi:MAG: ribosome biogenesis GTPase YlqF [Lachnospira sp.]